MLLLALGASDVCRAADVPAGLTGLWEFDDSLDLGKATLGAPLAIVGTSPVHAGSLTDTQASPHTMTGVITTHLGLHHLEATHGIAANGGGARVNQYTLVFDALIPAAGQWRSFYQTATSNSGDAEYFVRNSNSTLGRTTISYSTTAAPIQQWMRLVVTADLTASGAFRSYVNGAPVHTHTKPALDGEYSLETGKVLLFADNDNENHPLSIDRVAVFSRALTAQEVADLGGPGIAILRDPANQPPSISSAPAGPAAAATGVAQAYSFTPLDPDGNLVQVQADWGGTLSAWSGFGAAGSPRTLSHAWPAPGSQPLRARARDNEGAVSDWVDLQTVAVSGVPVIMFATPPYLQNMATNRMVVMWETAEDIALNVACGPDASLGRTVAGSRVASGGGTWFHRALIDNLAPGTQYHYRVVSTEGDPVTADAFFRTAPDRLEDFTFAVFSDVQTQNNGAWQADPWQPAVAMMQHAAARGPAFGLGCGDHAQNGDSYASTRASHLDRFARHFGVTTPFYIAWGNHDGNSPSHPLRLSADLPSRFRAGLSPGHGNYSFSYCGVFFVCLDYFYYNNEITNGWLESQLTSAEARAARFRILAVHVPPYCERWIDGDATLRSTLVPLLEQHDVALCLSGHTHEYGRGFTNGVHYVITGGGSYLDHTEPVVTDWPHMTVGGAQNVPGSWARQSSSGVLGAPAPIVGGLFNQYCEITVRGDFLRLDCHGFNADGSYIGVLDSFSIGVDPGPDTDGDGLRDAWEILNGLNHESPDGDDGPAGDNDHDGAGNYEEMIAGTLAGNPASRLHIGEAQDGSGGVSLTWASVPGRRYRIRWSDNLRDWNDLLDGGALPVEVEATAAETVHVFPRPAAEGRPLYLRVRALEP